MLDFKIKKRQSDFLKKIIVSGVFLSFSFLPAFPTNNYNVASAAEGETPQRTVIWSFSDMVTIKAGDNFTKTVDASNYTDLRWKFTYDITELDGFSGSSSPADFLTYVHRYSDKTGISTYTGYIYGQAGVDDPIEKGTRDISFNSDANTSDLTMILTVHGNSSSSDKVKISDITLTGVVINPDLEGEGEVEEGTGDGEEGEGEEGEENEGDNEEDGDEGDENDNEDGDEDNDNEGENEDGDNEDGDGDENEEGDNEDGDGDENEEGGEDNEDGDNEEEEDGNEEDNDNEEGDEDNEDNDNEEENGNEEEEEEEVSDPRQNRDVVSYRENRDVNSYRVSREERVNNHYKKMSRF